MTKIRTDLLRQLAEHLLHGKMGHEKFDFSKYNYPAIPHCGTNGCAMGETPILWPNDWMFCEYGYPVLKVLGDTSFPFESAREWFNVSEKQYEHLFGPYSQNNGMFGGKTLGLNATKEQVAKNILIFCDKADKGDFNQ
jgi:hypothetical protein